MPESLRSATVSPLLLTETMRVVTPLVRSLLLAATAACVPARHAPALAVPAPRLTAESVSAEAVTVDVSLPARLRWVSATVGPHRPRAVVVVTNRGAASVDVSNLRVHFDVEHEGIPFPCDDPGSPGREPTTLAPQGSHRFERTLDCALPLVGTYAIRARVSFGRGAWATPREVRTFALRVESLPEAGPQKVEPIPGLWAAFGTSNVLIGHDAPAPGRMVVTLVNGGATPLELPRFRLAVRVYRRGSPIPCEDAPLVLATPPALGVGDIHREAVDISCLGLDVSGHYQIAARLQIPNANEIELGRIEVEVSSDPTRRLPAVP